MTTAALSYAEFVAVTRREGEALLTAGRLGLAAQVPACSEWDVGRLLLHVGRVYRWAGGMVRARTTDGSGRREKPPPDADPVWYCADGLDETITALTEAGPDSPVWNWSDRPQFASFWARRMAHESLVHRYDAQSAHGIAQRIEPDLAADGVDELIEVLLPRVVERAAGDLPSGTYALSATDGDRRWRLRIGPDGLDPAATGAPDVTLTGSSPRLLLVLYGRMTGDAVEIGGRRELVDQWHRRVRI